MDEKIILENVIDETETVQKQYTKDLSTINIDDSLKELNKEIMDVGSEKYLAELYKTMLEKNPNAKCPTCGGAPMKGKTCPTCGSGSKSVDLTQMEETPVEVMEELFIPSKYRQDKFVISKLKSSHENLIGNKSFEQYTKLLDSVLGRINNGVLEKASLYISAPSGFGKETFAYTALQLAKSRGLTVFPYLDLMEVSRLISAYDNGKMQDPIVKDIKFTDTDLYRSEVCILKVPHNNVSMNNYKVLLQVIDRRSRRGLPTILLSRYKFNYFTALDYSEETKGILSYNNPSPKNLQVFEMNSK